MHCSDVNHRSVGSMDGGRGGVVQISMCMLPVVAVLLRRWWLRCSSTSGCVACSCCGMPAEVVLIAI
jgi:hypothetical protein